MNKWDLMLQEELNKQPINLHQFVHRCCAGFPVNAQEVVENLLSADDEHDIINGETPAESLSLHIELWVLTGKPHHSNKKRG